MVEILRTNFLSLLPHIEDCLRKCDFVAVDTEFTGLAASVMEETSLFDLLQERYSKVRKVAQNFIVCQIGLSAFIKDASSNKYIAHSFNFYVLPRHCDTRYCFQASNIEFLCRYKFDFNKLFYEGIPYVNFTSGNGGANFCALEEELGFSQVFKLLIQLKKPLLGHNMFYDLLLLYEKFIEPLPVQYVDFKQKIHALFPLILDTKSICLALRKHLGPALDFSNLFDLYTALLKTEGSVLHSPTVCHASDCLKYNSQTFFHEAAYDAFCVGYVFLKMGHLEAMQGLSSMEAYPVSLTVYLKRLQPYSNKVNLSRCRINFVNFAGEDPLNSAPPLLLVSVPRGLTITRKMVEENLGDFGPLDIQLMNKRSAVVALTSIRRVENILQDTRQRLIYVRKYSWVWDTLGSSKLLWCGILISGIGVTGTMVAHMLQRTC